MIKEGKFGVIEAVSLTTLMLMTKAFYTSLRVLIKSTSTAAWYTTLISCITSMILFLFVYLLMKRFPNKDLVEVFQIVTGKFMGKILSLIFCGYFIFYAGSNIREFLEMIKAYILPYTPPSAIIFIFISVVVAFAYVGLEGIARVSYFSFITVLIGLGALLLFAIPLYNYDYLFPVGGYGLKTTLHHGFLRGSAYSDVIYIAFIINSLHGVKSFKKIGLLSLALAGVIISLTLICNLMVFQYTQGSENLSPLFQLSRVIYFSRFLQRVDPIFLFIWVIASLITVSIAFYIAVSIFCKAFKVPNHKPSLMPFSFLMFMVSLLPKSLSETLERNILFIREYSLFLVYTIPILVLLITIIRRKKGAEVKSEKV